MNRYIDCSNALAIINSVMNTGLHVCFLIMFFSDIYSGVRLQDHIVTLFLVF